jgi:hypothetical protein
MSHGPGADGPHEGEQEDLDQGMDQSMLPGAAYDPAMEQAAALALGRTLPAPYTGATRFGSGPVGASLGAWGAAGHIRWHEVEHRPCPHNSDRNNRQ